MDFSEIKELIDLLAARRISTFELEKAGFKIKIEINSHSQATSQVTSGEQLVAPTAPTLSAAMSVKPEPVAVPQQIAAQIELYKIKAPIVGTFYRAPSPTSEPFVKIGDRVELGQVLCIIEAMKLMNEIESEVAGEILEIYVENGQPVEYGQPLFGIRAS
ncbi:MAG: acetyl-CoA carboxylase biotin carboxyl carrier protein [Acidobacteriota bacterium]|nr:acetyl-CoA carboxylase biotin carboxyl carrier protein [Blastocatellia bacterium]MDW8412655.1 acetyl-CoA carboxylase biotin carboxyl carrier protein [Acidobacteriota bacterium]